MVEIRTRKEFLDIADVIDICKFKDADLSFREACYTLKSKVNRVIRERMNEVFKIDEDKQKEYETKKFEYLQKYAVKDKNGNIVFDNANHTSFGLDFSKFSEDEINKDLEEWSNNSYGEHLAEVNRIENEKAKWLNTKVKLDLKKVDSIDKIPDIVGTYNDKVKINTNIVYSALVDLLCLEKVESSEEDGAEVE